MDSTGREHMILNFYVQGKPPGSSSTLKKDPTESYLDAVIHWTGDKASLISELTLNEVIEWSKDRTLNAWEQSKRAFRYLSGAPLPPISLQEHPLVDVKEPKKAKSTGWSFVGMFSGLRGKHARSMDTKAKRLDGEMWTDGEVHADLIRVCFLSFQTDVLPIHAIERRRVFRVPVLTNRHSKCVFCEDECGVILNFPVLADSGSHNRLRLFVERSKGVREDEPTIRWNS